MKNPIKEEQKAVGYLLGVLPEQEQSAIEERFFTDSAYSDFLQCVEDDLIDDYVRDELTANERKSFEKNFLITKRRRERVVVAEALLKNEKAAAKEKFIVAPLVEKEKSSWLSGLIATLFAPRPAFAYGFAAVAIAAALFAWFWVGSENRRLKSDIARLEDEQKTEQQKSTELQKQNKDLESQSTQQSEELNAQLKTEREKLEQAQSQNEKLKGKIDALEKERNQQTQSPGIAAAIATFILRPGVRSNDDPERFSVSKNTRAVRFQLQIERGDDYPLYRTELRTAGGKLVWSQDRKQSKNTAAGKSVAVTIPASFLNSGEYELTLRGVKDGQIEDLRYYYFSILKR